MGLVIWRQFDEQFSKPESYLYEPWNIHGHIECFGPRRNQYSNSHDHGEPSRAHCKYKCKSDQWTGLPYGSFHRDEYRRFGKFMVMDLWGRFDEWFAESESHLYTTGDILSCPDCLRTGRNQHKNRLDHCKPAFGARRKYKGDFNQRKDPASSSVHRHKYRRTGDCLVVVVWRRFDKYPAEPTIYVHRSGDISGDFDRFRPWRNECKDNYDNG